MASLGGPRGGHVGRCPTPSCPARKDPGEGITVAMGWGGEKVLTPFRLPAGSAQAQGFETEGWNHSRKVQGQTPGKPSQQSQRGWRGWWRTLRVWEELCGSESR